MVPRLKNDRLPVVNLCHRQMIEWPPITVQNYSVSRMPLRFAGIEVRLPSSSIPSIASMVLGTSPVRQTRRFHAFPPHDNHEVILTFFVQGQPFELADLVFIQELTRR